MKTVSFKVAKALKEIGYPQWNTESADNSQLAYDCVGELWEIRYFDQHPQDYYSAPYYLEVWLWLWREKQIDIYISYIEDMKMFICESEKLWKTLSVSAHDQEDAIIAAIEYLVNNNLIK